MALPQRDGHEDEEESEEEEEEEGNFLGPTAGAHVSRFARGGQVIHEKRYRLYMALVIKHLPEPLWHAEL
jgi:hypothetical protein